jgi:DNA-binding Lrp family transcriptional regulator
MMSDVSTTLDTTIEEWRAELERMSHNDPGSTLFELAKSLGVSESTMRRRITQLINEGKCIDGIGQRIDSLGRSYDVTVYQLRPKKKGNK